MDPITGLIQLIGFPAAMIALAVSTYFLIARRTNKATTEAVAAQTAQQNAITAQFVALAADNKALQVRINALEVAADTANIDRVKVAAALVDAKRHADDRLNELRLAQEQINRLMMEVKALTEKVSMLETERVVRENELRRERTQVETTSHALATANEKITELQGRVSRLEGENTTLKMMLTKLNVIAVTSDGTDPDPDPPGAPAAMHFESETRTTTATTTTTTEDAA